MPSRRTETLPAVLQFMRLLWLVDRQRAGTVEAAVRAALAESTPDEHAAAARVLVRIADALERPSRPASPARKGPRA